MPCEGNPPVGGNESCLVGGAASAAYSTESYDSSKKIDRIHIGMGLTGCNII
jgi:hypothetical protein